MESKRFVLAIKNDLTEPGPYCSVTPLHTIEIVDADVDDEINIIVYGTCFASLIGPGMHEVDIPRASVRVVKAKSTQSRVSVFGWG